MANLWHFVRERWYWVLGALLGIGIVYLFLRQRQPAVQDTSSQGAVSQSAISPDILAANSAAQAAAVQAHSQAQAAATAAAAQVQIAQLQLQQQQDVDTANVSIANSGFNSALAIQQSNNAAAISIMQTQTGGAVAINQAQVGGAVAINAAQTGAAVDINKYNNDTALAIQNGLNWTQLQAILSNNATALGEYTIQGSVANNAITTAGNVDMASTAAQQAELEQYYRTAETMSAQELQAQTNRFNTAASILSSGQLNKGGEGGLVQQTAFAALVGSPAATASAVSAGQVGVTQAQSTAQIINSVMSGIAKVGTAVLA